MLSLCIFARMKLLDKWLQQWRTNKAINEILHPSKVLDVGCYDAIVLEKLYHKKKLINGIGIDPLIQPTAKNNYQIIQGWFPNDLPPDLQTFDVITLIAVLEHIPANDLNHFIQNIYKHLKPNGKVIITVPNPLVDIILKWLMRFKILDGMSVQEHYGFDVSSTPQLFSQVGFELHKHRTFQLGLNNLFVFVKK